MSQEIKTIVVTGVSTGIGNASVRLFLKKGYRVFGSVRTENDARRLSEEFGASFSPLLFDVTNENAIRAAAQIVRQSLDGKTLFGLVNNAGTGIYGPLLHLRADDFRRQLDVNLTGLLIVTQAFAPLLGTDRSLAGAPGRVINLGSILGTRAYPFLGPTTASKFGLEGLSDVLRMELMLYGIDVIVIAPGQVATAAHETAKNYDLSPFKETDYYPAMVRFKEMMMMKFPDQVNSPDHIASIILKALTVSDPKVHYSIAARPLRHWILTRIIPKRWSEKAIARQIDLAPKSSRLRPA